MESLKKDITTKQKLYETNDTPKKRKPKPLDDQKCDMCDKCQQPVSHFCKDCKYFICANCENIHLKTALKSHKLQPVQEIRKYHESKVNSMVSNLKKDVIIVDKKIENVSYDLKKIEQFKTKHLKDLRTFTEELISELKANENRLERVVIDSTEMVGRHLMESQTALKRHKQEKLSHVNQLENLIQNEPVKTLSEAIEKFNETIENNAKQLKEATANVITNGGNMQSPVTVKKGKKLDLKGVIEVIVDEVMVNNHTPLRAKELYSQLWLQTFEEIDRIELDFAPEKLICVNDQLWCVDFSGNLHIYDKACQPVTAMKNDKFDWGRGVAVTDMGLIIIACSQGHGLHECLPNGDYNQQIVKGNFSDVTTFKGDLYALECAQRKLMVFMRKDNHWTEMRQYQLLHDAYGRVCVKTTGIYISSSINNCVYIYNTQGKFKQQIGGHGNTVGTFYGPFLCGVDDAGNILVADSWNHRLQVYNHTTNQWHVVILPYEVKHPWHAVVGDDGPMWVILHDPCALVKFEAKRTV